MHWDVIVASLQIGPITDGVELLATHLRVVCVSSFVEVPAQVFCRFPVRLSVSFSVMYSSLYIPFTNHMINTWREYLSPL